MMNCNWLVKVAVNDRNALIALGADPEAVKYMDHNEVIKALKALKYDWKKAPKLNGNY